MRRYLYATTLYALIIVALHLFSSRFSPLSSWGFYHFQEFGKAFAIGAFALAVLICLPPVNSVICDSLNKLAQKINVRKFPFSPHLLYIFISIAFIGLFWSFRSGNLFLGDGVTVAKVARTDEAFRYYVGGWAGHITSHQVLDYWLARNLHRLFSSIASWESYDTVALRNCIAGGVFVFAVLEIGHTLFQDLGRRIAFSAAVFTTGAMQLFFGYVETYSLATAFLTLYCLATLLYVREKSPIWPAVLFLAISGSLHLLTLGAGLALLFAYLHRSRERGWFGKKEFLSMAAIPVLIAATYFLIFHAMGFSLAEIFLPPARKEYEGIFFLGLQRKGYLLERYTLFSLAHLIDIGNEILLASPFGLFLCFLAVPALIKSKFGRSAYASDSGIPLEKQKHSPEPWILLLVAAIYLIVTLTAAPLLGARKDWDVFAPPWIFITMLGVYLLFQVVSDERTRGRILLVVIGISLLCTTAWIVSNSRIDLDKYLEERGAGNSYAQEGLTERALKHYETALHINFTPELAYKIARLRMENGDLDGATEMLRKAIREENRSELALFLEQEEAHFALGSIYLSKGENEKAISQFKKALDLWLFRHNENFKRAPDVYYHLGVAYLKKQDIQSAEDAFLQSIELADLPPAHFALAKLYARGQGKKARAFEHLSKYLQKNPGDTAAIKLLEELKPPAGVDK